MTEKRALAQDGSVRGKSSRDGADKKRRKLLHDDAGNERKKKSKSQGINLALRKHADETEEPALGVSQELSRTEETPGEQQLAIQTKPSPDWSISHCAGGRFLNLDPVFAGDGRYLLLATENEVQVFSMSTSRIVRTLSTPDSQKLTGYKLSPLDPERLFASTRSGSIVQWNWESGVEIQTTTKPHPVIAIDVASPSDDEQFLFALCERGDGKRQISANVPSDESGEWESVTILTTNSPLSNMTAVAGGRIVFAWVGDRLFVGHTTKPLAVSSLKSTKYTWREIRLPVRATCLDARVDPESEQPAAPQSELPKADVVLGETAGSILIYNDIIGRLKRSEKNESDSNLVSSRLHWHRKAVKAVRWSKDGNYVISGGLETVLVLWQLDTGRKQFLPHLSAPICNLVVSPQGTSYAVRLGDNSAMVLSTSELRPIASMSGLQLPRREDILARPLETKGPKQMHIQDSSRLPATLHPIKPDHLLLAVPSTQLLPSMETTPTASLLQAYDTHSGQHISRQALTRTNVSVLSSGPQGTELTTPDIKLVGISSDGDWLATVDEWIQYPEDSNVLRPNAETSHSGQGTNRETFLKFWQWDENRNEWQLVTRIDGPHFGSPHNTLPVLDLAVQPENRGFATVGGDGVVRIWRPDIQRRPTRNKDESKQRTVRSWQCSQIVVLEKDSQPSATSCLSFSGDGSILAACWPGAGAGTPQVSRNLVHLIDPVSGTIRHSRDDLFAGTPRGMGFLDRYLIILSDRLVVWDIVSDEIRSMFQFSGKQANSFLAVNPRSQTFAVTHSDSQLTVFEPTSLQPVFQSKLKTPARTLLPDMRSGEYIVVDTAAQVMRAGSGQRPQLPASSRDEETDMAVQSGLENIFGSFAAAPDTETAPSRAVEDGTASHATRGTKSLTDIFDVAPSFAMPAVDVLFRNVVDLFSGSAKA